MISADKEIETELLNLLMNYQELAQIEKHFQKFNIFEALGMVKQEIKHSNAIATFFDAYTGLGFDHVFKNFIRTAFHSTQSQFELDRFSFELSDYKDLEVLREYRNIDLIIISKSNNHVFVIENKIDAVESDGQLERYRKIIDEDYPASVYKRMFLFLTPKSKGNFSSDENWIDIYHEDLIKELQSFVYSEPGLGKEKILLVTHYIDLVKRHIMQNEELEELALKIYQKHKVALDYIFEVKPDSLGGLSKSLQDRLSQADWFTQKYIFDVSSKNRIRFFDKDWDHDSYKLLKEGTGWTTTKRTLLWELELHQTAGVRLMLVLGPSQDVGFRTRFRDELQERIKDARKGTSDKFTRVWTSKKFNLAEVNSDLEPTEEIINLILKQLEKTLKNRQEIEADIRLAYDNAVKTG